MKETSFQRINNVCLIIIAAAVIMMVLIYTKIVMIPLVVSLFIFSMMMIEGNKDRGRRDDETQYSLSPDSNLWLRPYQKTFRWRQNSF